MNTFRNIDDLIRCLDREKKLLNELFIKRDALSFRYGNTELFDKQYAKFKSIKIIDSRVQPLYDLIMKYHRCYEQEGYIQND